jgi:hypothetical protein
MTVFIIMGRMKISTGNVSLHKFTVSLQAQQAKITWIYKADVHDMQNPPLPHLHFKLFIHTKINAICASGLGLEHAWDTAKRTAENNNVHKENDMYV